MKIRTKKRRPRLYGTLLMLAFFVMVIACVAADICAYASVDQKQPADVALVLGAGTDGGEVSPVFRERINHGIWLYQNGYVKYLLLTGGIGDGNEISDAQVAKRYAVSRGVPSEAILTEDKSTITQQNLEYAKDIMDAHGLETAILVSDPLHMKRAMLGASDAGIAAYSSPTPTSMYKSVGAKAKFLSREVFYHIGYCTYRIFLKEILHF